MNDYIIKIKNILCPIDFSECSHYALKYASTIAEQFQSTIHVVHILPLLPFCHAPYYFSEDDFLVMRNKTIDPVNKELNNLCNTKVSSEVACKSVVIEEDTPPFKGIVDYVKAKEIDLIVIATHGCTGIKHSLFGSTIERVVRHASCPVLTVKNPEHEFIYSNTQKD